MTVSRNILSIAVATALAFGALVAPAAFADDPAQLGGVAHTNARPVPDQRNSARAPAVAPPPNDAYANAQTVTTLPYSGAVSYAGATLQPGETGTCRTTDPDGTEYFTEAISSVWFRYTSPVRQTLTFSGGVDGHYSIVGAYKDAPIASLQRISCVESEYRELNFVQAEAGQTYYFQVSDSWYSESPVLPEELANFTLSASAAIPNTTFGSATVVNSLPATITGSNTRVDFNWYDPYAYCGDERALMGTLWYKFQPSSSASVRVDSSASNYPADFAVYDSVGGVPGGDQRCAGRYDVWPEGVVEFFAQAGKTYFIQVGSSSFQSGTFNLALTSINRITGSTPTISGTAAVGSVLTANPGAWGPAPVTFSYQWQRNDVSIPGATAKTYTLTAADAGEGVSVLVTGSKTGYTPVTLGSTKSVRPPLLNLQPGTPVLTGTVAVGQTVTATTGTWTPTPDEFTYIWQRNGVEIAGAYASTYVPVADDLGTSLTVSVRGYKVGYNPADATSAPKTVAPSLQTLTPTPTISGTLKVGSTLTATPGTWDAGVTLSYQWKRNGGSYILGATSPTYVLRANDAGATLTVSVTGTKPGYSPATKTSATTGIVAKGTLTAPTPSITGTPAVGKTLTAVTGSWGPAPVTLSYQWKRNGVAISGATGGTYKVVSADVGKRITVSVTGVKAGYETVTKGSAYRVGVR
ncbi:hypothetical protein HQQ80_11530 [Microbacteriaceae bacterium VKM Ac-2855]|nr:hypothetical protein [Microbacteriaceae bacterium VKM Ac-2855]